MSFFSVVKRLMPPGLRRRYHWLVALIANVWYGRPSRHLIVIGVTGTDGKTTTATIIAELLQAAGRPVGLSSSVWFQIGARRWLNETHMTMPGRFGLQRLLRRMVKAGCRYAVVEVSSEGLAQHRHIGVDFDIAVVTNLALEHLEAHGSFERYRAAKGQLFGQIIRSGDKRIDGYHQKRVTVVNLDDASADYFLKFWAEEHVGVSLQPLPAVPPTVHEKTTVLSATDIRPAAGASEFVVDGRRVKLSLPGRYNIMNALEAIAVARACDVPWETIVTALSRIQKIPGRQQEIPTERPWRVIVDYALTPNALEQLYRSLRERGAQRIIAVFGAAGGGRDRWKRPELGKIAARYCQKIILTTDDPYDEEPLKICEAIRGGIPADQQEKVTIELDRRQAIQAAMQQAQPGDVVAITGMGSETSMMVKGKKVKWSDAQVVREELSLQP